MRPILCNAYLKGTADRTLELILRPDVQTRYSAQLQIDHVQLGPVAALSFAFPSQLGGM